jgi:hypothetical protein
MEATLARALSAVRGDSAEEVRAALAEARYLPQGRCRALVEETLELKLCVMQTRVKSAEDVARELSGAFSADDFPFEELGLVVRAKGAEAGPHALELVVDVEANVAKVERA